MNTPNIQNTPYNVDKEEKVWSLTLPKLNTYKLFTDSEEICRPEICSASGSLGNLKLMT